MMHSTSTRLSSVHVHKHRWWRPLLWAGLLALTLLLLWQAASSAILQAAQASSTENPWRFVDESKPGVPAGKGDWTTTADDAPTEIAALFTLSSTMQGLALQYHDGELGGLPLAQLEELDYCTLLVDSPRPYAVMLQLNLDTDVTDGDNSWQGRLVYTPALNGAIIQGDWQCWNTLTGKWGATGGSVAAHAPADNPQPLSTLLAQFPNLGIHADYSVIALKAGEGWSYFQGEASPVTLNIEGEQIRLAFGPEAEPAVEPNDVLLPVVYQQPTPVPQEPEADDDDNGDKPEKEKKDKQEKKDKEKLDRWRDVDWSSFDWENFDWESVDWEKVDWDHLDWAAYGLDLGRGERAEALSAFVADVKLCKGGGWEEMNFHNPGACVAYYIEQHISTGFDWEQESNERNDDDRGHDDDQDNDRGRGGDDDD